MNAKTNSDNVCDFSRRGFVKNAVFSATAVAASNGFTQQTRANTIKLGIIGCGNRGENFYRGGVTAQIYREGALNNVAEFHTLILNGDCSNTTTEPSVRSNLVTIMGRRAAYSGRVVTWDQVVNDKHRMQPDLSGLKQS